MKLRLYLPIRLKIMISLLLVVTAVVSVITFTMANLFHSDKETYINDLASIVALSAAEECRSLLDGWAQRLRAYARILEDPGIEPSRKSRLLEQFFEDFPALVALEVHRKEGEPAAVYDTKTLEASGLTREDLLIARSRRPLPLEEIGEATLYVENSSFGEAFPCLTLVVAGSPSGEGEPTVLSAILRVDPLLRLAERSRVFEVFLVDSRGVYLAHSDPGLVFRQEPADLRPEVAAVHGSYSAGMTLAYTDGGREMIGGFASAGGNVTAGAQIPQSAAYLASRHLLNRLLAVALGLLVAVALAGWVWSRRITRPVERLSRAAGEIAKGQFDIAVHVDSRDEIGTLARSFNQMASGLREREAALVEAQAQLIQSEKMAAFGQLGAGIAHEVKNPLAGILGCAQLSLRKADAGTPLHRNLELIEKETRRCKGIIDNLLKFARQEGTVFEPVEMNRVVEESIAIVRHQMELQRVKVHQALAQDLPLARGNANQLQQVLMNLMINAQHAMESEGGTITVTTRPGDDGRIVVEVADDGPGIPRELQRKIFEPFFTTKPTGKGTGLGLAVSFGIVKDHGGEIAVHSESGQGAAFTITLPPLPEVSEIIASRSPRVR